LWIADLDRDRTWMVTDGADSESYPSVSSTGEFIVFSQGEPHHDLVEISLDRRQIRPLLQTTRNESDPDVSRDGTRMVYVTDRSGQDEIWLHWRDGRQPDSPLVTQADFGADATLMLASPGFAPRGDRLAYLRNGRRPRFLLRVWISTVDSALRTPVLPRDYEAMQGAPTWSPTGQEIAYPELKNDRWNLMTLRVSGKEDPVTVRRDGVANASAHWSPTGEWITWETPRGLVLVSPDGARIRPLGNEHEIWTQVTWLVHAWSHDGTQIFGITQTDDRRLKLMSARVATGAIKELMDLGLSPVVNNPVKGFSVSADGRTFTTSLAQAPGDLWLLKGLRR
jgi:Tol biopolymer transport system component